jgi:hypothetical protein
MSRKQLTAITLALTAIAAAGCGSSKGGSTTTAASTTAATTSATTPIATPAVTVATGKPLSRAQWVAAGDAICHRLQNQLASVTSDTTTQFERALPQAVVFYAATAEDLSKLIPPKAAAHDWQAYVNDIHLFGEYTNLESRELKKGQKVMAPAVRAKVAQLQTDMISRAKRYGFKWCSIGA